MTKLFKKLTLFLGGNPLTDRWVNQNILFFAVLFLICIAYISNGYTCIAQQKEIAKLELKLKEAKLEALNTSALLMGNSRETKVEQMIKNNGVTIGLNNKPIYRVN